MSVNHLFVDTNILVYAHDRDAGDKNRRAKELVAGLWERPYPAALSVQVLQEFFVNLVKKNVPLPAAEEIVQNYCTWEVIINDVKLMRQGIQNARKWKISYWDATILAAAQRAKARVLWSEDLSDGQEYDGVRVENPLK